jgi:hypothetical protein
MLNHVLGEFQADFGKNLSFVPCNFPAQIGECFLEFRVNGRNHGINV